MSLANEAKEIEGLADLEAGPDLDELVAREVLGLEIVKARAVCIYVEGEWSISKSSSDTDGWACHAERRPIYSEPEQCNCEKGPILKEGSEYVYRPDWAEWIDLDPKNALKNARDVEEFKADMARFGHSWFCLNVVPDYSTSDREALLVVDKVRARGSLVEMEGSKKGWKVRVDRGQAFEADRLSLAICGAVLERARRDTTHLAASKVS